MVNGVDRCFPKRDVLLKGFALSRTKMYSVYCHRGGKKLENNHIQIGNRHLFLVFPNGVIVGGAVAKTTGSFQFSSESQITAQDKKLSAKTVLFDSVRDQCKDIAYIHSENIYVEGITCMFWVDHLALL